MYDSGADLVDDRELDPTPVLVSEPVVFDVEFRCFIKDGRVITACAYCRNGLLNVTDQGFSANWEANAEESRIAMDVANAVSAALPDMPRTYVLDVGHIVGRGWAVVEANATWGSGVYGCETKAVLSLLLDAISWGDGI